MPKAVEFRSELPRDDSGKIFKRKLRDPYWEQAGRKKPWGRYHRRGRGNCIAFVSPVFFRLRDNVLRILSMGLGRVLKLMALAAFVLVVVTVGGVVGVLMYGGAPMKDGATIGDGKVTLILSHMGPVRIGAYLVELNDGGYALVDAGLDPKAEAIIAALQRRGATARDVRAVFLTHAHDDHFGGARAFPEAQVFALDADAAILRRGGRTVQALADGDVSTVAGTSVEAFAVPGHTAGSAAYLVRGVLFVGDAAASISETGLAPNDFAFTKDGELNKQSLRALAARLQARAADVRHIAFGHQGPVAGLRPLLAWAQE